PPCHALAVLPAPPPFPPRRSADLWFLDSVAPHRLPDALFRNFPPLAADPLKPCSVGGSPSLRSTTACDGRLLPRRTGRSSRLDNARACVLRASGWQFAFRTIGSGVQECGPYS